MDAGLVSSDRYFAVTLCPFTSVDLWSTGKLTDGGGASSSRTPRVQTTSTNTVTPTNEPESGSGKEYVSILAMYTITVL